MGATSRFDTAAIVYVARRDMMSTQTKVLAAINDATVRESFQQSIQKQRRNGITFYRLVLVTKQYEILTTCSTL
jgi:hypothetical protein